jgi:hypothetical protein
LGAFTVTACKGLGTGFKELFTHKHTYSIWLTFICAIIIIVCILIQMIYLNRALDLFVTPVVTTVYYVLFTTCVLVTSGILFHEWRLLTFIDITGCLIGFCITTCGLVLINYLKTNTLSNDIQSGDISVRSSGSTSVVSVKQQNYIPTKSYADLLLDDNELLLSTNSINEQHQSITFIDECDLNS